MPTAGTLTGSNYPEQSVVTSVTGWNNLNVVSGLGSGAFILTWKGKYANRTGDTRGVLYYSDGGSEVGPNSAMGTSYSTFNLENPTKSKTVVSGLVQVQNTQTGVNGTYYCISGAISGLNIDSKTIQTNTDNITASPKSYALTGDSELFTGGTTSYDISFDGGSTFDTGKSFNTLYSASTTGSLMTIKLNLSGAGDYDSLTKLSNYAVGLSYG